MAESGKSMGTCACAETGSCDGVAYGAELTNCLTNASAAPALAPNYADFLTCALLLTQDSCSTNQDCAW